jgi:hypothetical protein
MENRSSPPIGLFAACALLIAAAPPALAQAPQPGMAAMRAADREAASAAGASRLPEVRAHLQQALNCLAGGGDGGPCAGPGALRQLPAGSANHVRVQKAIPLARGGVTFHDFKPAHFTAMAVEAVLDEGAR